MINKKENQKGQAIITLLFIMVISVAIITSVVIVAANNIASGSAMEQATVAYYAAEAGAHNAILRSLRDPSYTGETLDIDDASVTIQVNGNVITSVASFANSIRKIEVQTMYNSNNVLSVESWREIQ
jgi:type II secretory pathway component PulK